MTPVVCIERVDEPHVLIGTENHHPVLGVEYQQDEFR